jgi:hypothetical protein
MLVSLSLLIFTLSEMSISHETISKAESAQSEDHVSLSLPAPVDPKSAAPISKEKDKTKLTK